MGSGQVLAPELPRPRPPQPRGAGQAPPRLPPLAVDRRGLQRLGAPAPRAAVVVAARRDPPLRSARAVAHAPWPLAVVLGPRPRVAAVELPRRPHNRAAPR